MAGTLVASFQPHMLLVDVTVPWLDGVELCSWVRESPGTRDCRIIITTAALSPKEQGRLPRAGADGCLDRADEGEGLQDLMAAHLPVRLTGWS